MNTVVVPNAPPPIVGNKYRLGRILGAGGMGFVHEAEHMALGERVALKFLRPECSSTPEHVERFLREAKSLFKIKSDNVVRLLDVDAPADCAPYLVMEFLEGETLGRVLDRIPRLEVPVATEIVRQMCAGLAEAHRLGIVHRDVKPQNVMLTTRSDGTVLVKLVDFGIAFGAANELTKRLTMTEAVIGTPSYMSPEQLRSARATDERSDVFSVGVVLYEALTGKLPWDAESPGDLIFRQFTEAVPVDAFPEGVPLAVAKIVIRCLSVDPGERFADAGEVASVLEHYAHPIEAATLLSTVEGTPIARPASRPSRQPRPGPVSYTFAREKMHSTGGRTAFERHHLVPRGTDEAAPMPSAPHAANPPVVASASDRHGRALLLATLGGTAALLVVLIGLVAFSLGSNRRAEEAASMARTTVGHGLVSPAPSAVVTTEATAKPQAPQPPVLSTAPPFQPPEPPITAQRATAPKTPPARTTPTGAPARAGTNSSSGSLYTDTKW